MSTGLSRAELRSRYLITGRLVLDTALHIGGGREVDATTDSPVVRLPSGDPHIPGSSLKGAFRAAVERIALAVERRSCALIEDNEACKCLSTWKAWREGYVMLARSTGRTLAATDDNRKALASLELEASSWLQQPVSEDRLLALLDERLCDTCKTFGSVHLASAGAFHDLHVVAGEWCEIFQVRDGVGIDRDSGRARRRIKFDFEVVPPGTSFGFSLSMESPAPRDFQLVALGLQEFAAGMVPIGGIRSRGLGRCRLDQLKVHSVDFGDPGALRRYLLDRRMEEEDGAAFIARHLKALAASEEGSGC